MAKKLNSIHSRTYNNSHNEKQDHKLLLRTFYEAGRLKKLQEYSPCAKQVRWIWGAIALLVITSIIGFIRLELIAIEQAKRTDAVNLIRHSMTHPDKNINFKFINK